MSEDMQDRRDDIDRLLVEVARLGRSRKISEKDRAAAIARCERLIQRHRTVLGGGGTTQRVSDAAGREVERGAWSRRMIWLDYFESEEARALVSGLADAAMADDELGISWETIDPTDLVRALAAETGSSTDDSAEMFNRVSLELSTRTAALVAARRNHAAGSDKRAETRRAEALIGVGGNPYHLQAEAAEPAQAERTKAEEIERSWDASEDARLETQMKGDPFPFRSMDDWRADRVAQRALKVSKAKQAAASGEVLVDTAKPPRPRDADGSSADVLGENPPTIEFAGDGADSSWGSFRDLPSMLE